MSGTLDTNGPCSMSLGVDASQVPSQLQASQILAFSYRTAFKNLGVHGLCGGGIERGGFHRPFCKMTFDVEVEGSI